MIFRSLLFTALFTVFFSTHLLAGDVVYPIFRVSLSSVDNSDRKVAVELYSLGADGLFVLIDGKTVGKVAVIETDPKFVFKRYLANWDQASKQFKFTLQHETWRNDDGSGLDVPKWKMFVDGKRFASDRPEVTVFPQSNAKKHKLLVKTIFAVKPGGMTLDNLSSLLYPLPVVPYRPTVDSVEYFHDEVTGVRRTSAKFSVVSRIPTEHTLAYIRGTTLTVRVDVAEDTAVPNEE